MKIWQNIKKNVLIDYLTIIMPLEIMENLQMSEI